MIGMLPLAGADDWIGVAVFIVIMIISAISQMAGNKKEAQPKPRPRPRPPVRPAQAGPARPAGKDPVAGELEEFLRRAAGGRAQQPAHRPPPPPRPKPAVARPVVAQPVEPEVVHDLEVVETVADHVSHSVGESRLPSSLSRQQPPSDEVGHKFDHQMGQLDSSPRAAAHAAALAEPDKRATAEADIIEAMPPTAAAGLAAMLASPTSLRQAILLKEILERPEHRWS